MTATADSAGLDGRALRAMRTRAGIVAAHVDLLQDGNLRPRAEEITGRAGVSVRSLWTHFPDLESLFQATAAEVLDRQDADFRPVDPTLPIDERIDAYTRQRARVLERIGPFARASVLREPESPSLRDYHRRHVQRVSDELRVLFAAELADLPESDREAQLLALTAVSTWGSWSTLRDDLGLDREAACAVVARSVMAIVLTGLDRRPVSSTRSSEREGSR